MTDSQHDAGTAPANAPPPKLSEATQQALRDTWRAAGGVAYSSPKGQIAAMNEQKLFVFLAAFLRQADSTAVERGAPAATDMQRRLEEVETALFRLVKAVCPGLAHDDLLADAGHAIATMASAEPAAFFAIDDTPLADGSPRYLQVQGEFSGDEDVFALYGRAPSLAELAAHVGRHHVASDAKLAAPVDSPPAPQATKPAASGKKAAK